MTLRLVVKSLMTEHSKVPVLTVSDIGEIDLTPKGHLPKSFIDFLLQAMRNKHFVEITHVTKDNS